MHFLVEALSPQTRFSDLYTHMYTHVSSPSSKVFRHSSNNCSKWWKLFFSTLSSGSLVFLVLHLLHFSKAMYLLELFTESILLLVLWHWIPLIWHKMLASLFKLDVISIQSSMNLTSIPLLLHCLYWLPLVVWRYL